MWSRDVMWSNPSLEHVTSPNDVISPDHGDMVWLTYDYVMLSGDIMWCHIIRPHHITRRRHITRAHQMTITSSEHVNYQITSHHHATVRWCGDVMCHYITRPHHIIVTSTHHVNHQTTSHRQTTSPDHVTSWDHVTSREHMRSPSHEHTTSHHQTTVSWSGGVMWFSFDIVLWCYVVSSDHQTTSHNEIMSHHKTTWDHHHITTPRHITRWPCRGLLVSCSLVMWWSCDVIWWCHVVSLCDGDLTLCELQNFYFWASNGCLQWIHQI